MRRRLVHFLTYNNAFPLIIMVLFSGAATTFAASEEARQVIYSEETQAVTVDNTFLLAANIDAFSVNPRVDKVEEDAENYYVTYSYQILEVQDFAWREVTKTSLMTVSRRSVVGKDLGQHVAKQFAELVEGSLALLRETQRIELARGETVRQVATVYSGLVGKLFNPTLESFDGYAAVVAAYEPPAPVREELAAYLKQYGSLEEAEKAMAELAAAEERERLAKLETTQTPPPEEVPPSEEVVPGEEVPPEVVPDEGSEVTEGPDTEKPVLTLVGPENIDVIQGSSWIDPGATVADNVDTNLGVRVRGDDFDRNVLGYYTIRYDATDSAGNRARQLVRLVHVIAEGSASPTPSSSGGSGAPAPASEPATTTPPAVEPAPTPEPAATTTEPAASPPAEPVPAPTPEPTAPAETGTSTPQQ